MEKASSNRVIDAANQQGALDEVYRRIVNAHAALNEMTPYDRTRHAWVLRQLMSTLEYIESLSDRHVAGRP